MDELGIEGSWVFTPRIHRDLRGGFLEWFSDAALRDAVGYRPDVMQAGCSISRRGVLRGIHFADVPPGQAKYVSCLSGAVLDVIVDVRAGSPGFGTWQAVRLDDQDRRAVLITEGLGHGFMALSREATVVYLCSTPYAPHREHGVHPLDPDLGISWPAGLEPVLSDKDAAAPSLTQALAGGLLPDYRECLDYRANLSGSPGSGSVPAGRRSAQPSTMPRAADGA
jgi:dTDP-4-dehydrorhamnose 3,5-epimerase